MSLQLLVSIEVLHLQTSCLIILLAGRMYSSAVQGACHGAHAGQLQLFLLESKRTPRHGKRLQSQAECPWNKSSRDPTAGQAGVHQEALLQRDLGLVRGGVRPRPAAGAQRALYQRLAHGRRRLLRGRAGRKHQLPARPCTIL